MNVPLWTICEHSSSYSSSEPSTQWIASGSVSSAIFSTHLLRCLFLLRGTAGLRTPMVATLEAVFIVFSVRNSPNLNCNMLGDIHRPPLRVQWMPPSKLAEPDFGERALEVAA